MSIILQKSTHEIPRKPGEPLVRLTTRVIKPGQTGYMGHLVIGRDRELSFWSGVDAALELANKHIDSMDQVDYSTLFDSEEADATDPQAFNLGVKAVFITWDSSIGLSDEDYRQHTFFEHSKRQSQQQPKA